MTDDKLHTRDRTGPQQRALVRHHDLVTALSDAHLPAGQRHAMLEHVDKAITCAQREQLGGARYLSELADEMPDVLNLPATTRRLAGAFVHPSIR